jgi:hypothetical protein
MIARQKPRESWRELAIQGDQYGIGVTKIGRVYYIVDMTRNDKLVYKGTHYGTMRSRYYNILTIRMNLDFLERVI